MPHLCSNAQPIEISEQSNKITQMNLHTSWMICVWVWEIRLKNWRNIGKLYMNSWIYSNNIHISSNCPSVFLKPKKSNSLDSKLATVSLESTKAKWTVYVNGQEHCQRSKKFAKF